jgi:hypothetical protein
MFHATRIDPGKLIRRFPRMSGCVQVSRLAHCVGSLRCSASTGFRGKADLPTYDVAIWQAMPSRPGEFHPEPLTDPDVNLSIHSARATARRLPPSAEPSGSSWYMTQLAQAQRR